MRLPEAAAVAVYVLWLRREHKTPSIWRTGAPIAGADLLASINDSFAAHRGIDGRTPQGLGCYYIV